MQKKTLDGKVALITGAARRIGAEISRILHDAGMNVVLHNNASLREAVKLCDELNRKRENSARTLRADLQSTDANELIQQTVQMWESLHVLVNNASRYYRTPVGKVNDYAWDDLLNSNLKAPFFLAQSAAPYLARDQGTIINLTDIQADVPLLDYSVYCISKGALITMTKVLAKELSPLVRVNAVSPGTVLWPEGENTLSDEEKQKIISRTSLSRVGTPEDIAKAVLFLIRDADYINGQVLCVDGGRIL